MTDKIENVWDYPRPPGCLLFNGVIKLNINKKTFVVSKKIFKVIETSHPPTYYYPLESLRSENFILNDYKSYCEWKGIANYFDYIEKNNEIKNIGWTYINPSKNFRQIKKFISIYPHKIDSCYLNGEKVRNQKGDFYGGWITSNLIGPFKGGPNSDMW